LKGGSRKEVQARPPVVVDPGGLHASRKSGGRTTQSVKQALVVGNKEKGGITPYGEAHGGGRYQLF